LIYTKKGVPLGTIQGISLKIVKVVLEYICKLRFCETSGKKN
jgi:hypothetical protein